MFDISWTELLVIGVIALIAIGPKELPGVLRMAGQWMGKVRRMASEFQGQFNEAMREAEMADIKKHVDDITDTAKSYTNFDPLGDIGKQFETAVEDKPKAAETADPAVATAPPAEPVSHRDLVSPDLVSPNLVSPNLVSQDNAQTAASAGATPADPAPQPKAGSGA